ATASRTSRSCLRSRCRASRSICSSNSANITEAGGSDSATGGGAAERAARCWAWLMTVLRATPSSRAIRVLSCPASSRRPISATVSGGRCTGSVLVGQVGSQDPGHPGVCVGHHGRVFKLDPLVVMRLGEAGRRQVLEQRQPATHQVLVGQERCLVLDGPAAPI